MTNYNQKGFGLIGVIIVIFIIAISLVGILDLANMSLEASSTSKMRLIASGLAQEAIEVIRDMRNLQLEWSDWYGAIANGDYRLQYDSVALMSYSETPLKLDANNGLYQYGPGENTLFYRKATLTKISDNEVKVVVEVKWQVKSQWHYLTAEDRLWNWK